MIQLKVKFIQSLPPQSGATWTKQAGIFETEGQYPKKVVINFWKDKISLLSNLKVNDLCEVSCDIESREFKDRWYTEVSGFKLTTVNPSSAQGVTSRPSQRPEPEQEDLPF
jgi:hypothetical protein